MGGEIAEETSNEPQSKWDFAREPKNWAKAIGWIVGSVMVIWVAYWGVEESKRSSYQQTLASEMPVLEIVTEQIVRSSKIRAGLDFKVDTVRLIEEASRRIDAAYSKRLIQNMREMSETEFLSIPLPRPFWYSTPIVSSGEVPIRVSIKNSSPHRASIMFFACGSGEFKTRAEFRRLFLNGQLDKYVDTVVYMDTKMVVLPDSVFNKDVSIPLYSVGDTTYFVIYAMFENVSGNYYDICYTEPYRLHVKPTYVKQKFEIDFLTKTISFYLIATSDSNDVDIERVRGATQDSQPYKYRSVEKIQELLSHKY